MVGTETMVLVQRRLISQLMETVFKLVGEGTTLKTVKLWELVESSTDCYRGGACCNRRVLTSSRSCDLTDSVLSKVLAWRSAHASEASSNCSGDCDRAAVVRADEQVQGLGRRAAHLPVGSKHIIHWDPGACCA